MKAVLGFMLIGGGLGTIYLVLTGKLSSLSLPQSGASQNVAPVTNAGIATNTAEIPSQKGSGGMSLQSSVNYIGSPTAYRHNDRYASRGGLR